MKRNHLIRRLVLGLILTTAACGSATDSGDNGGNGNGGNPSITISLSASSLSIARGTNGSVTATIARAGGFDGAVSITVEGMPSGVTAAANPATIGGDNTTSTITLTASAQANAGTGTITVRASGSGVTAVTATFSLTVTVPATGSYTMSLSPTSLSIQQGEQKTATVNLTRTGGFTGSVALAASGAPTGVTPSLNPASTTGNTSTLTVVVGASVAAGNYTLTITGTATGIANQTATLALTVTSSGGGSGNVTYTFCPATGLPAWFAYQDGLGAWTRVTGNASNQYSFTIASGRGGVAWVKVNAAGSSSLVLYYASQQELTAQGGGQCGTNPTAPVKTINGSVANVGTSETAYISFNGGSASASPLLGNNFTLNNVLDGPGDLVASRTATTINGTSIVTTFNKGIIRRGINPANGSTLPVLDFNAEGFTPDTRNLTVNGLAAGENAIISLNYFTASGAVGLLYSETFGAASGTRQYNGVPSASQQAGDLHLLTVSALNLLGGGATYRSITSVFKDAADRTVTLGPDLMTLAVSTVATARLAFNYTIQSQYNRLWFLGGTQATGSLSKSTVAYFTAGWLGSATNFDYAVPDFNAVAGWNTAWNFVAGTQIGWYFNATGWNGTGGIFGAPNAEGVVSQTAVGTGTITP